MAVRSNDGIINKLHLFTRRLPPSATLFSLLFLLSIFTGIVSVALANYHGLEDLLLFVMASGVLSGILIVLIPTLLTVLIVKSLKREVRIKYLLFIALIGALVYSFFIILSSAIYQIVGNYSLSSVVVLVGDASIYGWWFFINKVVLGQKKKAVVSATIQPIFNVLLYFAASGFIFNYRIPLSVIFIKLFAGILIFLVISYVVLYIFDSPLKRNLGFGGIEVFSQVVQNWLFDIDMIAAQPMGGATFGTHSDIDVHTMVFTRKDRSIKAILFAPWLHYGPLGVMGGSDFPYQLERHSLSEYEAPLFALHCAVNEDSNPVSNSQLKEVREALDRGVKNARSVGAKTRMEFFKSRHRDSTVSALSINGIKLVTFTRAPRVTEDIATEASMLFKELMASKGGDSILIDAHNSRYESAPQDELRGVAPNSRYMNEYVKAIKNMNKPEHTNSRIKIGVSNIDIYDALGRPEDLAPGRLNVMIFYFNGFKYAIVQFNSNNVLPYYRNEIIDHVKKNYGIECEVYTTDTHFVNSLDRNASNVLGRSTKLNAIMPLIDKAFKSATTNAEIVEMRYKKDTLKRFHIWGPNVREKMIAVITSVMGLARIVVPAIVAAGFVVATWIISLV